MDNDMPQSLIPPTADQEEIDDIKAQFHTRLGIINDQLSVVSNILMKSTIQTAQFTEQTNEDLIDLMHELNEAQSIANVDLESRISEVKKNQTQKIQNLQELLSSYREAYTQLEEMQEQLGQMMNNKNFKMPKS